MTSKKKSVKGRKPKAPKVTDSSDPRESMTAPDTSSLPERENDEVTEEQIERTKQILGNTIHARTGKDFRRSIVEADKLLAERKTTSNSPRLIFQRGTRIGNLKGYLQKVYADDFSLTAEENEEKAARRNPTRRD